MDHILLHSPLRYTRVKTQVPLIGYDYDMVLGAWVTDKLVPMIKDPAFEGVATKKKDIETGEDQK